MTPKSDGKLPLGIGKQDPIRFNIMVVGESGQGKTTFLKTLFKSYTSELELRRASLAATTSKTVEIKELAKFPLPTQWVDVHVHLYDSPGYGDYINNQNAIDTVHNYLVKAHKAWSNMKANTLHEKDRNLADGRVHCLFYFIAPHRMKDIDNAFIRTLTGLAPIVPVIAKSDTMTLEERRSHLLDVRANIDHLMNEMANTVSKSAKNIIFDFQESGDGYLDVTNTNQSQQLQDGSDPIQSSTTSEIHSDVDTIHPTNQPLDTIDATQHIIEDGSHIPLADDAKPVDPPSETVGQEIPYITSILSTHGTPELPKIRNIFAVVCDIKDRREYPWGSLDIFDERHSDFRRLQRLAFENGNITKMKTLTQSFSIEILEKDFANRTVMLLVMMRDYAMMLTIGLIIVGMVGLILLLIVSSFDLNQFRMYIQIAMDWSSSLFR